MIAKQDDDEQDSLDSDESDRDDDDEDDDDDDDANVDPLEELRRFTSIDKNGNNADDDDGNDNDDKTGAAPVDVVDMLELGTHAGDGAGAARLLAPRRIYSCKRPPRRLSAYRLGPFCPRPRAATPADDAAAAAANAVPSVLCAIDPRTNTPTIGFFFSLMMMIVFVFSNIC
jgi:hypothetical protein